MSAFLSRDFDIHEKKKGKRGEGRAAGHHRVHIIIGDERVAVVSGGFQIPLMHMNEARNIEQTSLCRASGRENSHAFVSLLESPVEGSG